MNRQQWDQIESSFHAALELDPHKRANFLAEMKNADVRSELESLLRAFDSATQLERSPLAGVKELLPVGQLPSEPDASSAPALPARIGPYRVQSKLGDGGMGSVYLAVRDDQQFEMKVAIKLTKRGMDSEHLLARFRQERQTLAKLDHPNIARLLDGGETGDGLPYLVMEYIDGLRIDYFVRTQDLTIVGRLKLFTKVCSAVQYAHQNLVVHRDIKPANILIDERGEPKLLDFGIAKLLAEAIHEGADGTRTIERRFTPEYASPEQIRGEPVSTTSDVYSLGVVLYELLTNRKPYLLKDHTVEELERAIAAGPIAPSRVLAADVAIGSSDRSRHRLGGVLPKELDAIVLTTMHPETSRRYSSVAQLQDDIERCIRGLPVQACPPSRRYQLKKFVRRYRAVLTAAAIVAISILAGATAATVGLFRAVRAERLAMIQQRVATERLHEVCSLADAMIFDVHDTLSSIPGTIEARKKLVQSATTHLDRLSDQTGDDPTFLAGLASAYERLGDIQGGRRGINLGDIVGARSSYVQASRLRSRIVELDPLDLIAQRRMAENQRRLAEIDIESGDFEPAHANLRVAISTFERILQATSTDSELLHELATAQTTLGDLLFGQAKFHDAMSYFETARANLKRLAAAEGVTKRTQTRLAVLQQRIACVHQFQIRMLEALEGFRTYQRLCLDLRDQYPEDQDVLRLLAISFQSVGDVLGNPEIKNNLGDVNGAKEQYAQMLEITRQASSADPANAVAARDHAMALHRAGDIEIHLGAPAVALERYDEAHLILERLYVKDPTHAVVHRDIAVARAKLANAELKLSEDAAANLEERIGHAQAALNWLELARAQLTEHGDRYGLSRGDQAGLQEFAAEATQCESTIAQLRTAGDGFQGENREP